MCQPVSDQFLEAQELTLSETLEPGTPPRTPSMQQADSKEAELMEARSRTDVAIFALYLAIESGETVKHPWLWQPHKVAMGELDPRELLKVYLEKPHSLTLRDCRNPNRYWRPASLRCKPGVADKFSKAKALRALVGKTSWKNNPHLQAILKERLGLDSI